MLAGRWHPAWPAGPILPSSAPLGDPRRLTRDLFTFPAVSFVLTSLRGPLQGKRGSIRTCQEHSPQALSPTKRAPRGNEKTSPCFRRGLPCPAGRPAAASCPRPSCWFSSFLSECLLPLRQCGRPIPRPHLAQRCTWHQEPCLSHGRRDLSLSDPCPSRASPGASPGPQDAAPVVPGQVGSLSGLQRG